MSNPKSASGTLKTTKPVFTPAQQQARKRATIYALIATLGPFFYGFEGMVLNGAINAVGSEFNLGPLASGLAGSAGIIGGLIGALFAGRISDKIGRKRTMVLIGPFLLFEAIFGAFSPIFGGYWFLIFTRIVGGMGFGAATTVAPGYVAEIAPADIRGRLIGFRQLAIILGLFFAGTINFLVGNQAGGSTEVLALGLKAWQWMFMCLLIPALFFVVLTAIIPESPRYLVSVGRNEEAREVLAKVSGETKSEIDQRIVAIRRSFGEGGESRKLSIGQIWNSQWRSLVLVAMAIAAFQQLTGTNGIFFYSNMLFESVGFSENAAFQQTLILTFFKLIGVTTGIMLVDKVGRKRMLMYGGTLIAIALFIVASVFTYAQFALGGPDISGNPVLGWLAVGALCLFLLGFTSSWGPIFSILMGEMFPNEIRGGAMSLASGTDFFVNFIVVLLFPFLVSWSPAGTYWIYFVFGVLAIIFTGLYVKETTGKSLEEMG
ncbi:MAG: sugar porter family MFS transporter [Actinomycetaceae bacterium]|nr:sugar porter family MFS transporter [Actinomycetaceae bacterium]